MNSKNSFEKKSSKRSRQETWFEHSFNKDYLYLYAHRDSNEALLQVENAIKLVPFQPGQKVLDLACGGGRHMHAFAKLGADITGVDLSSALLERAKQRFAESQYEGSFIQADMRDLSFENHFDGVTMWFTSFGYFTDECDNALILQKIKRALKPKGWWWIDISNPAQLRRELIPESIRKINGPNGKATVREIREIDCNRVKKYIEIEDVKGRRHYIESVRLYESDEFDALAKEAGLKPLGLIGDYDLSGYSKLSPRQIWFGAKA